MKTLSIKNLYLYIGLLVLAIVITMFGFIVKAKGAPSTLYPETTAAATSSVAFVAIGGPTFTFQVDNPNFSSGKIANVSTIDAQSLYVQAAASSTTSVITVTPQYSNNNVDWYSLGSAGAATALGVITVASSTVYSWQPGTTATTSMVFKLPDVQAFHERFVFGTSAGSSTIYAEVDLKKNPSTP